MSNSINLMDEISTSHERKDLATSNESRPPNLDPDHISDADPFPGNADSVSVPDLYKDHLDGILISNAKMKNRVQRLSELIHKDYAGKCPLLLCVLKGAAVFFHELSSCLSELKQAHTYEYIRVSSYSGTKSTQKVTISGMNIEAIKGRDVIVVEDIVDTGNTLMRLLPHLETNGSPKSLFVCTMLEKRIDNGSHRSESNAKLAVQVKYCGFSIPDRFVIGYGLDYNEMYRDLKDIWIISEKGIANEGRI